MAIAIKNMNIKLISLKHFLITNQLSNHQEMLPLIGLITFGIGYSFDANFPNLFAFYIYKLA